jgi:2-polyprenyl-3-methyl-5-hydroxy-6-metoxy-1,4-benzoquinol methylase
MDNESNTSVMTRIRKFAGRRKRHWKRKIKRTLHFDAKVYYRSYIANSVISPLNEKLVQDILSYNPKSVLEFGCGVGKNLELIGDKVDEHLGIDISTSAIEIARKKKLIVINGDEDTLKTTKNHDIVFTCSVLDHIEEIDDIVSDFKRIANLAIVIAETNTKVGKFYYPHDYESLGFVKTDYVYVSSQGKEEAYYHIWHYKTNP